MVVVNLVYLVLFLLGIGLWLRSVLRLRGKINWQGLAVVVGAACLVAGVAVVSVERRMQHAQPL
jgi:hypothetical protein